MSSSTFKIIKSCLHCGKIFEAQKTTTRFCSHKCNSADYKIRLKLSKKHETEKKLLPVQQTFRPEIKFNSIELIKQKEFLSVKEIAILFNCVPKTVYSLINSGRLKAVNIGVKKTIVKRSEIDKLFA